MSAGADDDARRALRAFGFNLGLAFQLADDALDYGGETAALGKNAGDDFREGKATLPLMLAIARTGADEAAFWQRTVGQRKLTDDDFLRARELIMASGAIIATLELAGVHAGAAKQALSIFPANGWRAALDALADFSVSRRA